MNTLGKMFFILFLIMWVGFGIMTYRNIEMNAKLSAANEEIKLADERTECLVRELDMVKKDYWASEEKLQRLEKTNAVTK